MADNHAEPVSAQERESRLLSHIADLELELAALRQELDDLDAQVANLDDKHRTLVTLADQVVARCERAEIELAQTRLSARFRLGSLAGSILERPSRIWRLPSALRNLYQDWRRYRSGHYPLVGISPALQVLADQINAANSRADVSTESQAVTESSWVGLSAGAPVLLARAERFDARQKADAELPIAGKGQTTELEVGSSDVEQLVMFNVTYTGSLRLLLDASCLRRGKDGSDEVLCEAHDLSLSCGNEQALFARFVLPEGATHVCVTLRSRRGGDVANGYGVQAVAAGLSVVMPTYRGVDTILSTLESVASQRLAPDLFETIIVQNGPDDGTRDALQAFCAEHPNLSTQLVAIDRIGAGAARNAGIALAGRQYVTFLDDDDWISAGYLSSLLAHARPSSIAVAQIVDVIDGKEEESPINQQIEQALDREAIHVVDLNKVMCMSAAKAVPANLARQIRFDESLRSGEDVQYFSILPTRFNFDFNVVPLFEKAFYRRRVRRSSLSRQPDSFDFCINQRLDVIGSLMAGIGHCSQTGLWQHLEQVMRAQINFSVRYLESHPEDYAAYIAGVEKRGLVELDCIRWANAKLARTVVFSYCFAPYIDTAGVVAAKRIREDGVPVDVISNRMDTVRKKDKRLSRLVSDLAGEMVVLDTPTSFADWRAIQLYAERGVDEAERLMAQRSSHLYERIYSRAMWPGSHFAAAALKARYPSMRWVAEFSDPLWMDIQGKPRGGLLDKSWLNGLHVTHFARKLGVRFPRRRDMFFWCEYLPYLMADELIFTNENQLHYMMSYLEDATLEASIRQRAVIKRHPVLPAEYYHLAAAQANLDTGFFNMAYFGSFYANRGLQDVLEAMRILRVSGEHIPVRLHVYTGQADAIREDPAFQSVKDAVVVNDLVGYLDFLSLSTQFDCLIVTDTATADSKPVNPYLPSKVSDYLGSGVDVWAIVEPGSALDGLARAGEVSHCTMLGDVQSAADVIRRNVMSD